MFDSVSILTAYALAMCALTYVVMLGCRAVDVSAWDRASTTVCIVTLVVGWVGILFLMAQLAMEAIK